MGLLDFLSNATGFDPTVATDDAKKRFAAGLLAQPAIGGLLGGPLQEGRSVATATPDGNAMRTLMTDADYAQPPAAPPPSTSPVAAPAQPSSTTGGFDLSKTIGGIYGQGGPGDSLIALGTGLLSKRGFGAGLSAGAENMQRQALVNQQTALTQQKAQTAQAQLQGRISYLKQLNPNLTDAALAATATNDGLFQDAVKKASPSETFKPIFGSDGVTPIAQQNTLTGKVEAYPQEKDNETSHIKDYNYYKNNVPDGQTPLGFNDWLRQSQSNGPKIVPAGGVALGADNQPVFDNRSVASSMDGDTIDSLARRVAAGDSTALVGIGRGRQGAENILAVQKRVGELTKDLPDKERSILQERANQAGRMQEQRTLGSASAQNTLYGNAAFSTMDTAVQASRDMPRTTWIPFNQLMQAGQTAMSDPKLAAFAAANNTLVNDYAKATTPVGSPTDSKRHEAISLLGTADSPEKYEAVVSMMRREVQNTHGAIDMTKEQLRSGQPAQLPASTLPVGGPSVPGSTSTSLLGGRAAVAPPVPMVGMRRGGYRYKGGDPSKPDSWEQEGRGM